MESPFLMNTFFLYSLWCLFSTMKRFLVKLSNKFIHPYIIYMILAHQECHLTAMVDKKIKCIKLVGLLLKAKRLNKREQETKLSLFVCKCVIYFN